MRLTVKQRNTLFGEAHNYADPDAFVSDALTSSLLLDPDAPDQEVKTVLIDELRALWHVANDPFKELLKLFGLTQTQCSIRFCIPLRTVQSWAGEARTAPPYVRLMMAELTDLFPQK